MGKYMVEIVWSHPYWLIKDAADRYIIEAESPEDAKQKAWQIAKEFIEDGHNLGVWNLSLSCYPLGDRMEIELPTIEEVEKPYAFIPGHPLLSPLASTTA